jgi:hypothetical protein
MPSARPASTAVAASIGVDGGGFARSAASSSVGPVDLDGGVDHGGLVDVGVGVDPADHLDELCHGGRVAPLARGIRVRTHRPGGRTRL